MLSNIFIDKAKLEQLCAKWRIAELAVFGSVLRPDFRPDSDIDILVAFEDAATWTLIDLSDIRDELSVLLGHPVDLLTKRSVQSSRNPYRKAEIFKNSQVIYDSAG